MAKLILFEGIDRSGKDTLVNEICNQTTFAHIIVNRGIVSYMVYAKKFHRGQEIYDGYVEMLDKLNKSLGDDLRILYVTADKETINKRVDATGHEPVDYDADKRLYDDVFFDLSRLGIKYWIVDTTNSSPHDCYTKLVNTGFFN